MIIINTNLGKKPKNIENNTTDNNNNNNSYNITRTILEIKILLIIISVTRKHS